MDRLVNLTALLVLDCLMLALLVAAYQLTVPLMALTWPVLFVLLAVPTGRFSLRIFLGAITIECVLLAAVVALYGRTD